MRVTLFTKKIAFPTSCEIEIDRLSDCKAGHRVPNLTLLCHARCYFILERGKWHRTNAAVRVSSDSHQVKLRFHPWNQSLNHGWAQTVENATLGWDNGERWKDGVKTSRIQNHRFSGWVGISNIKAMSGICVYVWCYAMTGKIFGVSTKQAMNVDSDKNPQ